MGMNPEYKDELFELALEYAEQQGDSIMGQLARGYLRRTAEVARLELAALPSIAGGERQSGGNPGKCRHQSADQEREI